MKRIYRALGQSFCILGFFVLSGCASNAIEMDNLNVPLEDLQVAAHLNMPIRSRKVSSNGREFYSEFFVVKKGSFQEAENAQVRDQARVNILGDRRPYDLVVKVAVEAIDNRGEYRTIRFDKGLARVISRRIQKTLHERLEHRNIIDDFRAF